MVRTSDEPIGLRTRGITFDNILGYLKRGFGEDAAAAILERAEGEAIEAMRAGSLRWMGWYPVEEMVGFYREAQAYTGAGLELPRAVGRDVAHRSTPLVFKMFTRILSPGLVIRRALPLFRRYYDRGGPHLLEQSKNSVLVEWRDCDGFAATNWADLEGGIQGTLEVAGAKDVEIERIEDEAEGVARYRVRWS